MKKKILFAVLIVLVLFILNKVMPALQEGTDGPKMDWSTKK
jgi:type II secretory pathway component PulF